MGVDTAPAAEEGQETEPAGRRQFGRRRLVAAGLTAAALAAGAWWWSHPRDLGSAGNLHGMTIEPGEVVYSGMSGFHEEGDRPLRIVRAEARELHASAEVRASVLVCERSGPGGGVGVVPRSEVGSVCAALRPAAGHEMGPGDQLVLEVAVESWSSSGVAVFDGIDVTYSNGLQRGTEHTGVVTEVRVEASQAD